MTSDEHVKRMIQADPDLKKAYDVGFKAGKEERIKELEEAECSLATAIVRLTLAIEQSAFGGGGQEEQL